MRKSNKIISSISKRKVSISEYAFEFLLSNAFHEVFDPVMHYYQPNVTYDAFINKVYNHNLSYIEQFVHNDVIMKIINEYYIILLKNYISQLKLLYNDDSDFIHKLYDNIEVDQAIYEDYINEVVGIPDDQ